MTTKFQKELMKLHFLRSVILMLLLFQFGVIDVCGQSLSGGSANEEKISLVPDNYSSPAPTASGLGRYGAYPVTKSTGVPNIQIPLFEIVSGSLNIPISLSYHASGIRVAEDAGWVGLGWSLNAGGVITRSINGEPDESGGDLSKVPISDKIYDVMNINQIDYNNVIINRLALGKGDNSFQSDDYYFNINGQSGKFVKGNDNNYKLIPKQPIKISNDLSKIVDSKGVEYYFSKLKSRILDVSYNYGHDNSKKYFSAIHMQMMVSADKQDTIRFEYQEDGVINKSIAKSYSNGYSISYATFEDTEDGTILMPLPQPKVEIKGLVAHADLTEVTTKKLSAIYFKHGKLVFKLSDRNDIYGTQQKLDKIEYYKRISPQKYDLYKQYEFRYSYFGGKCDVNLSKNSINKNNINLRLKLDEIYELKEDVNVARISYSDILLPPKNSTSIDYWGYYNGENNGLNPIPPCKVEDTGDIIELGTAKRVSVGSSMKAGIIKSIINPLKGKTTFEFEANSYYGKSINSGKRNINASVGGKGTGGQIPSIPVDGEELPMKNYPCYERKTILFEQTHSVEYIAKSTTTNVSDLHLTKYSFGFIVIRDNTTNISTEIMGKTLQPNFNKNGSFTFIGGHEYSIILCAYSKYVTTRFYCTYNDSSINLVNNKVGGLRIKTIKNYDTSGDYIKGKLFKYGRIDSPDISSGEISSSTRTPLFHKNYQVYAQVHYSSDCKTAVLKNDHCDVFSNAVVGINGNNISYKSVLEYDIDSNENYQGFICTEYDFTRDNKYADCPNISYSWERGRKIKESYYKKKDGEFIAIKSSSYAYKTDEEYSETIIGFAMGRNNVISTRIPLSTYAIAGVKLKDMYTPINYPQHSRWTYLESSSETIFDENGLNPVSIHVDYEYENKDIFLPTKEIITNGKGETITKVTRYPNDYSLAVENISSLLDRHIITKPIKQERYFNGVLVDGQIVHYSYDGKPEKLYKLNSSEETLLGEHNSSLLIPKNYKLYSNYSYNNSNRCLIEISGESFPSISYIWGYNNSFPVAIIQNASYSDIPDGLKNDLGNASLSVSQENMLRTVFPNSLVETCTYDPIIGVTSKTDANGITTYYEYDDLGRLQIVKDNNGNIMKKYKYNYKH